MMRFICISIALPIYFCAIVAGFICDDINLQACQLLEASRRDLCNDTSDASIAITTCPRYCGKCALECYHCDQAVVNFTDCNTTRACNQDEVCMLKELKSTADSHNEYIMTCEAKTHCDGAGLSFPFGRRDLESRDINVKCCDTDLCNCPSSVITTTMLPTPSKCLKDVFLVVDESSSMTTHESNILNFLASLVWNLGVGAQGAHVSMATYSLNAHEHFHLTDHLNVQDLQSAIKQVRFRGGNDDLSYGLRYMIQQATTPPAGDRANVPNVFVLITDHTAESSTTRFYEQSLHSRFSAIIAIGISRHVDSKELQRIAGDSRHVLQVRDSSDLSRYQPELVKTICS